MEQDPFIDPILQNVRAAAASVLVGATNALIDGAREVALTASPMACLAAISVSTSIITTVIQHYNNQRRVEEDAARERRREDNNQRRVEEDAARERHRKVLEQYTRRNEENRLRHGQEVRDLLADQANRQELALVASEQLQALARKRADFDSVIYNLKNCLNMYINYQRRYANDQSRLLEETKILQRDVGTFLMKLSSAMLRGHINFADLRVWANAAAFHIQMISHMRDAGIESTESLRIAVDIHRETAASLCSEYGSCNQLPSTVREIEAVKMYFYDSSNSVEFPIHRSVNVNSPQIAGPSNQADTETEKSKGLAIEMTASPRSGAKLVMVLSALVGILAMIFFAVVLS